MTNDKTTLVWAVQESLPNGSGNVSSAILSPTGKLVVAHGSYNFRVDFVNARSGKLVFATEGHAASITTGG